jgi:hypothetical protein
MYPFSTFLHCKKDFNIHIRNQDEISFLLFLLDISLLGSKSNPNDKIGGKVKEKKKIVFSFSSAGMPFGC